MCPCPTEPVASSDTAYTKHLPVCSPPGVVSLALGRLRDLGPRAVEVVRRPAAVSREAWPALSNAHRLCSSRPGGRRGRVPGLAGAEAKAGNRSFLEAGSPAFEQDRLPPYQP